MGVVALRWHRAGAAVILAAAGGASHALGSGTTPAPNTIALTGTDGPFGPHLGSGVQFSLLLSPDVNRAGQFAFGSTLSVAQAGGVWSGGGASFAPFVQGGDSVPGMAGAQHGTVNSLGVAIDELGDVFFRSTVVNAAVTNFNVNTYFAARPGQATVVARRRPQFGETFPIAPLAFSSIDELNIEGANSVAFSGSVNGTISQLWLGTPGNVRSVAEGGAQAPGTPAGTLFSNTGLHHIDLNRSGQWLFTSRLQDAGGTSLGSAYYIADGTSTTLLARSTDQAPGHAPGTALGQLGGVGALSDNGQAAVLSTTGLYIGGAGNLRYVAGAGMQAPGLPTGVVFGDAQPPIATAPGVFAFPESLQGPGVNSSNALSLWVDEGQGPRMIVRTGQSVPGVSGGVTLGTVQMTGSNELGQILLYTTLVGPGITTANDVYEMVWDPTLGLVPVAREGDSILLGDGTTRTILFVSDVRLNVLDVGSLIPGSMEVVGGGSPIGIATYRADFTDGSTGTFAVVVPTPPAAVGLLALGGLAGVSRRNGSRRRA